MSLSDSVQQLLETFMENWSLKILLSPFLATFFYMVGHVDELFLYLATLFLLDLIFGLTRAFLNHDITSKKGKYGAGKALLYLSLVVVANLADKVFLACPVGQCLVELKTFGVEISIQIRAFVISYLCVTEMISILEHLKALGAPVPKTIVRRLRVYKEFHDEGIKK